MVFPREKAIKTYKCNRLLGIIHGLRERDVKVIVLDVNEKRLAYAKETAKADFVINVSKTDGEKTLSGILGGELPPLVMDATGNADQMMQSFHFAGHGGTIVFVGLVRAGISFDDPVFHAKEITLMASRNATKEDFANVIAGMESGRVNTEGFVTHEASMEEAAGSFASWLKPETGCMKAVVNIS